MLLHLDNYQIALVFLHHGFFKGSYIYYPNNDEGMRENNGKSFLFSIYLIPHRFCVFLMTIAKKKILNE